MLPRLLISLLLFIAPAQNTAPGGESPETRKSPEAVVRQLYVAFNDHSADKIAALVAPDFNWFNVTRSTVSTEARGREELHTSMERYFQSTPGVKTEILSLIADGNYVSLREQVSWDSRTGRRHQSCLAVYEVRDGIIQAVWYYPASH